MEVLLIDGNLITINIFVLVLSLVAFYLSFARGWKRAASAFSLITIGTAFYLFIAGGLMSLDYDSPFSVKDGGGVKLVGSLVGNIVIFIIHIWPYILIGIGIFGLTVSYKLLSKMKVIRRFDLVIKINNLNIIKSYIDIYNEKQLLSEYGVFDVEELQYDKEVIKSALKQTIFSDSDKAFVEKLKMYYLSLSQWQSLDDLKSNYKVSETDKCKEIRSILYDAAIDAEKHDVNKWLNIIEKEKLLLQQDLE
jgi:hypothetical protein